MYIIISTFHFCCVKEKKNTTKHVYTGLVLAAAFQAVTWHLSLNLIKSMF